VTSRTTDIQTKFQGHRGLVARKQLRFVYTRAGECEFVSYSEYRHSLTFAVSDYEILKQ